MSSWESGEENENEEHPGWFIETYKLEPTELATGDYDNAEIFNASQRPSIRIWRERKKAPAEARRDTNCRLKAHQFGLPKTGPEYSGETGNRKQWQ